MPTRRRRRTGPWPILAALVVIAALALTLFVLNRPRPILLHGALLTPDGVVTDGWVLVENQRITSVSATKPIVKNAIEVNAGLIMPGLVDLHNHVSYDVLPPWQPSQVYADRYEWRQDPDYVRLVSDPYDFLVKTQHLFCDMNTYGELRALMGGTTSILATADSGCIAGLARNLDYNSGFYRFYEPDKQHVRAEIELRGSTAAATFDNVRAFLAGSHAEALVVHSAEGTDAVSLEEFSLLQAQGLLTSKTIIVHGLALGSAEFAAMQQAGAGLVWSPRSNVTLYGTTADILAALDAGLPVALAPDWAVTGSPSLLAELGFAAQWNADHLGGALTDEQLVAMATSIPARMAGIDDEVGALKPGLYADLIAIAGDASDPYHTVVHAEAHDVQLVLIGGQAVYGDAGLMASFWPANALSAITIGGQPKALKLPGAATGLADLLTRLQNALRAQGTSLAAFP